MSLVVARKVGDHICIVCDTKLSPGDYNEIGLKQHPADGVIKSIILNSHQCVSFAGNEYFAEAALQEIEAGGAGEDIREILFRYHTLSEFATDFIFCFAGYGSPIVTFRNGEISESQSTWIGDKEAFKHYQEYYHGAYEQTPCVESEATLPPGEPPIVKNIRMTVNSKVPRDEFSRMSAAIDHLLYYHSVSSIGGFRIQVLHDGERFSYSRYTLISNEEIDRLPNQPGRFGWSNAAKGSYYVNCAQSFDKYGYAAIHIMEANLGVLYMRRKNGLMRPELYRLDLLDFADFIAEHKLLIPVSDPQRTPKYYHRARNLFEREQYFEAIHWLCRAIRYSDGKQVAHLYYVLGLCFHNYGRPMTALLCFEHAISMDSKYQEVLEKHNR